MALRPDESASTTLRRLIDGFRVSQAIHVAATLGLADLIGDGRRSSADLAAATGSHEDALYRLLRALASVGIVHEDERRAFALTALGEGLRTDNPQSLSGWAAFVGRPYYWNAWAHLLDSVQSGENAFRALHATSVWEYRSQHPDESAIFDRAMTALTGDANRSLLEGYDFGRFATVVDVGGGQGALLASLLREHPTMHGVLFDQPHVVAGADGPLHDAGVADRCRVVGGSFFEGLPEGGDAYLLKSILHDWEDDQATTILRGCRRAMPANGVVLVVGRVLAPPNEGAEGKFSDLNMLVSPGGRERTLVEHSALFETAGLRLQDATSTRSDLTVIAATPA